MGEKTIGIDLGHCETSAAIPCRQNSNGSRYEVRRLVTHNKDQVISTQIILTNEQMNKLAGCKRPTYSLLSQLGEIRIGNKLPAYVPDGEKFCYFKVPPQDFDTPYGNTEYAKKNHITHGMLMACFAYALVDSIFKHNIGDLNVDDRKDATLLIGCPTTQDWTSPEAQSAYAELIQKATDVQDVRIIPESRAAMFSSVENEKNKVSALKGAIVFDFGSSTADCTYMLLGRKMIEFSWALGASEIERQMTLAAYREAVELNGTFKAKMTSIADIEDELRTAKESYYEHRFPPKGHPMICAFENEVDDSIIDQQIRIDDKFMKKITEENSISVLCDSKKTVSGTWQGLCRQFFEEAKENLESASYVFVDTNGEQMSCQCEIGTIVLTGGASRMDFVYEMCKKVFPEVQIYREENPSHTVSNGLGWVAVSDNNLAACHDAAKKAIEDQKSCSVVTLRNNVSNAVFDMLSGIAVTKTKEWADTPGDDLSVRDLQNSLKKEISRPEVEQEIRQLCKNEIDSWKNELSDNMERAVNDQVFKLYAENVARSIVIPNDIWKQLQHGTLLTGNIDVTKALNNIDMGSIANKIGKFIIQTVIWCIALALAPETFGLSIAAGFVASLVAEVALTDDDLDKKRRQNIRSKVAGKIKSKLTEEKDNMMESFNEDFKKQTEGYESLIDETLTRAFEIVTLRRFEM